MELADLVFGCLWSGVFVGLFELFHDMYEAGVVDHPLWSSLFPRVWRIPIPHHLYWFHCMLLVLWIEIRASFI